MDTGALASGSDKGGSLDSDEIATPTMAEIAKRLMNMRGTITISDIDSMTNPSSGAMVGLVSEPVSTAVSPQECVTGLTNVGPNKSYASLLGSGAQCTTSKFRTMVNDVKLAAFDCVLPLDVAAKIKSRYENSIVGFFIGKDPSFPVVKQYASNAWRKFGFERITRNDAGVYLFKFASKGGMEQVLEKGPWLIRKSPIILTKWTPTVSLTKREVTKVPVWVKMYNVPILAYSEDGLSLIATQIGKPIMLDAFTSSMCDDSWGRISFARALIEIDATVALKQEVTMAIPSEEGDSYIKETIRVEYEWKPPQCTVCQCFGHDTNLCPKRVIEESVIHSTRDKQVPVMEARDEGFTAVKGRNRKMGADPRTFVGLKLNKPNSKVIWQQKKGGKSSKAVGSTPGLNVANSFGVLNGDAIGQDRPQSQVNDQGSMGKSIPSSSLGNKDKEVSNSQELHRTWDNCFNPSDASDDDYGYDGYDGYEHLQSSKKDRDYKPQAKTKK